MQCSPLTAFLVHTLSEHKQHTLVVTVSYAESHIVRPPPLVEIRIDDKTGEPPEEIFVPVNGNFNELKTQSGKSKRDNVDASPLDKNGNMTLTDTLSFEIRIDPDSDAVYSGSQLSIKPLDISGEDPKFAGKVRIIAIQPTTRNWVEVPFDQDLVKDFYLSTGKYRGYTLHIEGIKPGKARLEAKLISHGVEYKDIIDFEVCSQWTKAQWQQVVRDEIYYDNGESVQIENYAAINGFLSNRVNIQGVFDHYTKVYTEAPENYSWAGLAKLAGAPVYAGLSDAQYGKLGQYIPQLGPVGSISASTLEQIQQILIGGNIAIFSDLAWQFEAYRVSGIKALEYISQIDSSSINLTAWTLIDQGIKTNNLQFIQDGNQLLLRREQEIVIAPTYANLQSLALGSVSWLFSIMAENPVPNGPTFASVVPNGNLAIFDDRWLWISDPIQGMWTLWNTPSTSTRLGWVAIPVTTRAADYSYASELYLPIW